MSRWETRVGCTWPERLSFPRANLWFRRFHVVRSRNRAAKPPLTGVRHNRKEGTKREHYTAANLSGVTRREKNCPSQTRLPEAAHRAATFSVLAAKVTWATEAKRGGAEGREGATDYGAVPDDAPVFSCPRATRRTEAAHRAATFSVLADEVTFATEAKRGAAEGREGATDYGAVPDDAPVFRMQARGAARSWSAAFTSAGDVPIQQARGAARLWSAASTSAVWLRKSQARGAARFWSAASTSAVWSRWLLALAAAAVGLGPLIASRRQGGGCGDSIARVVPIKEKKTGKHRRVRTKSADRPSLFWEPLPAAQSWGNGGMDRRIPSVAGAVCRFRIFRTTPSQRQRFLEGDRFSRSCRSGPRRFCLSATTPFSLRGIRERSACRERRGWRRDL